MDFSIGDRVKHSGYVTQKKRDYWNSCGAEPHKSRAKQALDEAIKERGTVSAILPGDQKRGVSPGLEITWDGGSISRCLSYMVAKA